jgi:hypothetical protein
MVVEEAQYWMYHVVQLMLVVTGLASLLNLKLRAWRDSEGGSAATANTFVAPHIVFCTSSYRQKL